MSLDLLTQPSLFPLYSALSYYVLVFTVGQIARKLVGKYVSDSTYKLFLIEFIGTVQMCTCVYENGIIVKNYGLKAFFLVVGLLQTAAGVFNQGAITNCVPVFEEFYFNKISSNKLLTLVSAQLIGASLASTVAYAIWNATAQYSLAHSEVAAITICILPYKLGLSATIAYEIIGAFVCRAVIFKLAKSPSTRRVIPFWIALYLAAAIYVVGVPGLNPIVANARMYGCQGVDNQSFFFLYWVCPVIGWMAAALLLRSEVPEKKNSASSTPKKQSITKKAKKA